MHLCTHAVLHDRSERPAGGRSGLATTEDFTRVCVSFGISTPLNTIVERRVFTAPASSASGGALPGATGRRTLLSNCAAAAPAIPSHIAELDSCPLLPAVPRETLVCNVGTLFPIMNRLSECKEHLRALAALDDLYGAGDWERHKRRVLVPIFLGMPGTGKSRFARDAVKHLVDALGSVRAVVDAVWPFDANREKVVLVSQLVTAALHR